LFNHSVCVFMCRVWTRYYQVQVIGKANVTCGGCATIPLSGAEPPL
jgi:hypothetical protein